MRREIGVSLSNREDNDSIRKNTYSIWYESDSSLYVLSIFDYIFRKRESSDGNAKSLQALPTSTDSHTAQMMLTL
jgi:hypothetical protein